MAFHLSQPTAEAVLETTGSFTGEPNHVYSVLDVTAETLRAFGYRVVTATDEAEAVAIFAQRFVEIDLVLTDMMMPVKDGPATVQVVKRLRPDVPIVDASGLDANGRTRKWSSSG